jgi:hypothetical protein
VITNKEAPWLSICGVADHYDSLILYCGITAGSFGVKICISLSWFSADPAPWLSCRLVSPANTRAQTGHIRIETQLSLLINGYEEYDLHTICISWMRGTDQAVTSCWLVEVLMHRVSPKLISRILIKLIYPTVFPTPFLAVQSPTAIPYPMIDLRDRLTCFLTSFLPEDNISYTTEWISSISVRRHHAYRGTDQFTQSMARINSNNMT